MSHPLGSLLRHHRTARGLSLRSLASRMQCSGAYLSKIEMGKSAPSESEFLHRLSRALELSWADTESLFHAAVTSKRVIGCHLAARGHRARGAGRGAHLSLRHADGGDRRGGQRTTRHRADAGRVDHSPRQENRVAGVLRGRYLRGQNFLRFHTASGGSSPSLSVR